MEAAAPEHWPRITGDPVATWPTLDEQINTFGRPAFTSSASSVLLQASGYVRHKPVSTMPSSTPTRETSQPCCSHSGPKDAIVALRGQAAQMWGWAWEHLLFLSRQSWP